MRLEFTVDIHRPVQEVFRVVGDLSNDPKWQSAVVEATKVTDGPVAEGARFRHVFRIMGRRTPLDVEFLHYAPMRRYVLSCSAGPLVFSTEVRFEPIARGTRVVTLIAGNPRGLLKVAAVTLSSHRRHEIEADLLNLKRMMEAGLL
jgi:uncharacterized membrane protein